MTCCDSKPQNRLQDQLCVAGDIVCRWGGEELACVARHRTGQCLGRSQKSCRCAVGETPWQPAGHSIKQTIQLRGTCYHNGRAHRHHNHARDSALYLAKEGGRHRAADVANPALAPRNSIPATYSKLNLRRGRDLMRSNQGPGRFWCSAAIRIFHHPRAKGKR